MSEFIHVNGQLLEQDSAAVSAFDAGLLHGAGLFETMQARGKRVLGHSKHLHRLTESARALSLPFAMEADQLAEMIQELLEANGLSDARVRLTITRGDMRAITAEDPVPPVTFILSATGLAPYATELYEKGMTVVVSSFKQNPENPLTGHKTTSYFDRLMGLREAQMVKAGEAIWFTAGTNFLAEGSISNVFLVDKEGILCTPPLTVPGKAGQRLCLPGITRQAVLKIATGMGILPHERMLTIEDVLGAREIFLTNAIMGVMPVTHLEKHQVGGGKPGSLTRQLRESFEKQLNE
jgi:branched-chain amino acid aminotransferase